MGNRNRDRQYLQKTNKFLNGETRDRIGILVTCEYGGLVTQTEYNNSIIIII